MIKKVVLQFVTIYYVLFFSEYLKTDLLDIFDTAKEFHEKDFRTLDKCE